MRTLIKTDKNGTRYYEETCRCWKCSGTGTYTWGAVVNGATQYAGVCFACQGSGVTVETVKEYTPEHQAKLDAQRAKREAKRQAEREAKEAELRAEREKAEAERKAKEAEIQAKRELSQYVGNVGDKLEIAVTVIYEAEYEVPSFKGWGTDYIKVYGMEDENGNAIIWKTTGRLTKEHVYDEYGHTETLYAHKGDKLTIKGTIKEHNEYKGQKQTLLNRVKLISIKQTAENGGAEA